MQPTTELGKSLSKHISSKGELIRAILWFCGALVLGIGGTLLLLLLNSQGNRGMLLLLGLGATALAVGTTLLWLIPAFRRYGQFVELYERGIVLTRRGQQQSLAFTDVKQVSEDIQSNRQTPGATSNTTIELTPNTGPPIVLAAGSFSDFGILRDAILTGVTKAMIPRLVQILYQGGSERVGLVNLTRDGILLDKTKGGKGLLLNWESLEGVDLDSQTGHVLLQTSIGVIDTQAWMQAIPHWFFLPILAKAMRQRLAMPVPAPAARKASPPKA
ncbi:hypothetical protein ETAA8_34820 [Anatilimnocola aggregata]|uniref:Uncharacterized protein n=1 Tax=Anatilimnocola aggregata TaxID=2528021 RepID=A0A517YE12_9BACT|nr:DUF6585 family protein [Anatilimnocola aggregata]QDU28382.1 hypothetical protein ETAA8_34820 [Anatilimnocola aggregata]